MDIHSEQLDVILFSLLLNLGQGFEWAIRDVHKLRDFVEGIEPPILGDGTRPPAATAADFEILNQSPFIGDHKFKLEIGKRTVLSCEGVSYIVRDRGQCLPRRRTSL